MLKLNNDPEHNIAVVISEAYLYFDQSLILAELAACQAILESRLTGNNPSELAVKYNNLFGIKGIGTNGSTILVTHEYDGQEMIEVHQQFASNLTLQDSFAQYAKLLHLPRYQNLWTARTFKEAALMIKEDGYATDPAYSQDLYKIFQEYIQNENN